MSPFSRKSFIVASLITLIVPRATAQHSGAVYLGVQGAYNFSDLNAAALGVHAIIGLPLHLAVYPAATNYLVSSGSLWVVSTTIRWAPFDAQLKPYLGAGPYWSRSSTSLAATTDVGLVTQIGAELGIARWQSFAELRILKDGAVSAEAVVGLRLRVHHW